MTGKARFDQPGPFGRRVSRLVACSLPLSAHNHPLLISLAPAPRPHHHPPCPMKAHPDLRRRKSIPGCMSCRQSSRPGRAMAPNHRRPTATMTSASEDRPTKRLSTSGLVWRNPPTASWAIPLINRSSVTEHRFGENSSAINSDVFAGSCATAGTGRHNGHDPYHNRPSPQTLPPRPGSRRLA